MLHLQVFEILGDVIEILFVSERNVVDSMGEIELLAFSFETVDNVHVWVGSNVNIAWYTIGSYISNHLTPLLIVKFFLGSFENISSKLIFLHLSLGAQLSSVFVKSVFLKVFHHVGLVSSKNILFI